MWYQYIYSVKQHHQGKNAKRMGVNGLLNLAAKQPGDGVTQPATRTIGKPQPFKKADGKMTACGRIHQSQKNKTNNPNRELKKRNDINF
jgi:hypothetical protein